MCFQCLADVSLITHNSFKAKVFILILCILSLTLFLSLTHTHTHVIFGMFDWMVSAYPKIIQLYTAGLTVADITELCIIIYYDHCK